jgi:DNA polymerase III delta prime subunit
MRYYETQYSEYIESLQKYNLHSKYENIFKDINFENLPNCILYGSPGIGKYTQALNIISKYSGTNLGYEKKVIIPVQNKDDYVIKISDIHFEVDMELLGCSARTLWQDIYNQIIDIIMASPSKRGIILCKNFHNIHLELLDSFYCYLNNVYKTIDIKFMLLTQNISFIPREILSNISVLTFNKPDSKSYKKLIKKSNNISITNDKLKNIHNYDLDNITNIKNLCDYLKMTTQKSVTPLYKNICDTIYDNIILKEDKIDFFNLRESLYNLLLYHHSIYESFYYILNKLYTSNKINCNHLLNINVKLIELAKLYNNNYRPIFHLERFSLYLNSVVNDNKL